MIKEKKKRERGKKTEQQKSNVEIEILKKQKIY